MVNRREFDIAFVGLKPGIHEFTYEVGNDFFASFEPAEVLNCEAKIKLTLEKNTSFMILKFEIDGSVEVICDRCGNSTSLQLWDEFDLIIKQVENPLEMNESEDDPDIFYISRNESHLHLADWIYEFVLLSIPNQRVCPENEKGESQCNPEVLARLKDMQEHVEKNNPMWKGLEKFRKNNH